MCVHEKAKQIRQKQTSYEISHIAAFEYFIKINNTW